MQIRGERLKETQLKAQQLDEGAKMFKENATKAKTNMWYKNMKMTIALTITIIVVILLVVLLVLWQTGAFKK
ncbi:hypothetical protein HDU96_003868 [Phlyctochytrium bullatum]|nr:hypothetical protein HDU96_003868 [Phlyctochytrium bullatum]